MIDCINLDNYAVSTNVSRYNEDGYTAQNLLIKSARRCKDCLKLLTSLNDGVAQMFNTIKTEFNAGAEELSIAEQVHIVYDKSRAIARYYFLVNENSKSLIELASDINKVINNMLATVPDIIAKLGNVAGIEDKLAELQAHIDTCYLDVYDECSYTTLELAGATARNVNEFITAVNMLESIADFINANQFTVEYDGADEMIITLIDSVDDNETLKL